jgi:hypothetical protein
MAGTPQKRARKIEAGHEVAPVGNKPPSGRPSSTISWGPTLSDVLRGKRLEPVQREAAKERMDDTIAAIVEDYAAEMAAAIITSLTDPDVDPVMRARFALSVSERASKIAARRKDDAGTADVVATEYVDSE